MKMEQLTLAKPVEEAMAVLAQIKQPDCALLYAVIYAKGGSITPAAAAAHLEWEEARLVQTVQMLTVFDLVRDGVKPPVREKTLADPAELILCRRGDRAFAGLCDYFEQCKCLPMTQREMSILLDTYQSLNLPANVMGLLIGWCQESGHFSIHNIEQEAYRWHNKGISTFEQAGAHLEALRRKRSYQGGVLRILGSAGRGPTETQKKYMEQWQAWGINAELLELAYDRTVTQTGKLNWPYLHTILERWHAQGYKSRRDVENISDLESYLSQDAYAGFRNYPYRDGSIGYLTECMDSMRAIVELCEAHGVNLVVVTPPMYHENLNYYSPEEIEAFHRALAEVTDYWDFTLSSVSYDPRYFYDETHFRNCVGQMAAARMAGDPDRYVPEDFGFYVTPDTVDDLLASYAAASAAPEERYSCRIPILMYHHVTQEPAAGDSIGVEDFASHMAALRDEGFTAVTFEDLLAYVETGRERPEKAVVITFDDGYESNLTLAGPILREYGMKATVFAIGVSVGKDTYKDTGEAMIPHFSLEEALEYADVIRVESHGYNIHEVEGRDPSPVRQGVLMREDESEEEYISFLLNDIAAMDHLLLDAYGREAAVLAYPHGLCSELSEILLRSQGFYATLSAGHGINTIIKGIPQSLRQMGRFSISGTMTAQDVLDLLRQ